MTRPITFSKRSEWDVFFRSTEAPQPTSLIAYRIQQLAFDVLRQPKPDFVSEEEFDTLQGRITKNLETAKNTLIDEFIEIMRGFGTWEFNRAEIARGELSFYTGVTYHLQRADASLQVRGPIGNLQENQKEEIWRAIAKLEFLTKLDLSNNQMSAIPLEFVQLSRIQRLDLSNNRISKIPAELGRLSQLRELCLYNNHISTVPLELMQLFQLRELYLYNNRINEIPAEFGQLSQLTKLYLSNNRISKIPVELTQLSQLRELSLTYNRINEIPAKFGQLSQLQLLLLYDNQINEIPAELGRLSQLQTLRLFNNPSLSELPLSLGSIPGITKLDTSGTQIPDSTRDAILASCQRLRNEQAGG